MRPLRHPLLDARGIEHGFGVRGAPEPEGLLRPVQVHGAVVTSAEACARGRPEADAVVCGRAGVRVGIVTADCVPVLLATRAGDAVAAVHAGWRGLAAGVVAAGVEALRAAARPGAPLVAAIGPHVGPCCYEVDEPVLTALAARFAGDLERALYPARPGHVRLDLGALVEAELSARGVGADARGTLPGTCTCCDASRFHSYRRDGAAAGRLWHFVAAAELAHGNDEG